MNDTERDALEGITATFYDYAEAADTGDPARFAELFTEDCRFDGGRPSRGRDWLRVHAANLLGLFTETSHHITQIRLRSLEGDVAHATAYVQAVHRLQNGEMFESWARYVCDFRFDDGRWRFSHHQLFAALERGTDGRQYQRLSRQDPTSAI